MTEPKKHSDGTVKLTPELSATEEKQAEKEGVKEALKQSAQTNFATQSATENLDEYSGDRWPDRHDIMLWSYVIGYGLDQFKKAIQEDAVPLIPESKVAGLLELERSGQNRTEYVQAMCKRLGVKSPIEVTNAGPGHTNDVSSVTAVQTKV